MSKIGSVFSNIISKLGHHKTRPIIIKHMSGNKHNTSPDIYWNKYTINAPLFKNAMESKIYLEEIFNNAPKNKELTRLYQESFDNQVILDYGCGPGNGLVGFLVHTNAKRIIGIDVSETALRLATRPLTLHQASSEKVELIQKSDSENIIPFDDCSIDHVNCQGVLQHTSNPESIVREFYRILKPGSFANVMVYNLHSLWLHLYVAYVKIILNNEFPGMNAYEAFHKTTDGIDCPIARCYRPDEFIAVCSMIGFRPEYKEGYFSRDPELVCYAKYKQQMLEDNRIPVEHREFVKSLADDADGYPMYGGKYAGVHGVYKLYKD